MLFKWILEETAQIAEYKISFTVRDCPSFSR
jgi:hypothetical protein